MNSHTKQIFQYRGFSCPAHRGSILPLVAVSSTLFFLMLAIVIDLGWILLTQNQLQNTADASALAAASQLIDEDLLSGVPNQTDDILASRDFAELFAAMNRAAHRQVAVDRNEANSADGDVVVGYIEDPNHYLSPFESQNVSEYNSVQVTARFTQTMNGPLSLFFGVFTRIPTIELSAQTIASVDDRVTGFYMPPLSGGASQPGGDGGTGNGGSGEGGTSGDYPVPTVDLLPFTVYVDYWKVHTDGDQYDPSLSCPPATDEDHYAYNTTTGEVIDCAGDGIPEVKMFPFKDSVCTVPGLPGNFGTIDIGPSNNSTADLVNQILNGVTQEELDVIGGLELTDDGTGVYTKWLNGDTGVSNGIQSAIEEIIGQPRILPLFRNATGNGNNAYYEIVGFVGVRIMEVKLSGKLSNRKVVVQPCQIMTPFAMVDPNAPHSGSIFIQGITR